VDERTWWAIDVMNERVGAPRWAAEWASPGGRAGVFAVYGAGTSLGAGICALIGEIARAAGFWTPLAFAVGAAVALVDGMTCAGFAMRFPRAGGPTNYVSNAVSAPEETSAPGQAALGRSQLILGAQRARGTARRSRSERTRWR
jgi:hypothetical protein